MNQTVIQYTESLNDLVRLNQYILQHEINGKYAVFNFQNQHTQIIKSISFTVVQYDNESNLITKNKLEYKDFSALGNSFFVPKVKLLLNDLCDYIIVYVDEAYFEYDTYIDGKLNVVTIDEKIEEEKEKLPYFHSVSKLRITKSFKLLFIAIIFIMLFTLLMNIYVNYYL